MCLARDDQAGARAGRMSISVHADGAWVLINEAHVGGPTICDEEIYYNRHLAEMYRDGLRMEFDNPDIVIYRLVREEE